MIYRGFTIDIQQDGRYLAAHHGDRQQETCASEDDAMSYVDAYWRRKRQRVDNAVREALQR